MDKLIYSTYNKYHFQDNDPLTFIGSLYNRKHPVVCDEFGYMNKFSKWNFYDILKPVPQPIYEGTVNELDILLSESLDVLKNKDFSIMYSGGVNSSAILVKLLENGFDNFNLVYSDVSIEEFPTLWNIITTQYPKLNLIKIDNKNFIDVCNNLINQMIFVTGCYGDKLFINNFNTNGKLNYSTDYYHWIDSIKLIGGSDIIIDMLDESFAYYNRYQNIKIKSTKEMMFWISFSVLNNCIQPRLLIESFGNSQNYYDPFYSYEKLHSWGLSKIHKLGDIHSLKPNRYKKELKEIIYNFTKDDNYYNLKIKEHSLHKLLFNTDMDGDKLEIRNGVGDFIKTSSTVMRYDYTKENEENLSNIIEQYYKIL